MSDKVPPTPSSDQLGRGARLRAWIERNRHLAEQKPAMPTQAIDSELQIIKREDQ